MLWISLKKRYGTASYLARRSSKALVKRTSSSIYSDFCLSIRRTYTQNVNCSEIPNGSLFLASWGSQVIPPDSWSGVSKRLRRFESVRRYHFLTVCNSIRLEFFSHDYCFGQHMILANMRVWPRYGFGQHGQELSLANMYIWKVLKGYCKVKPLEFEGIS